MSHLLADLINSLNAEVSGPVHRPIADLCLSTLEVAENSLFVAIVGASRDGHAFVGDAVRRGAGAVIVSQPVAVPAHVTVVRVPDTRAALTVVAARFFGDPSRTLKLVGVTGTNGKTTTTYLLEQLFQSAGVSPGVIGTVSYRFAGRVLPAPNTTPDLVAFQRLLSQMAEAGVDLVASEVSSHALEQRRVDGLHFDAAVFTNLTRDHLDYHGSLEAYFEAKARLFDVLLDRSEKAETLAVINADDAHGKLLMDRAKASRVWGFSRQGAPDAALRVVQATLDIDGIEATVETPLGRLSLRSPLLGPHNLENLLAAAGVGLGLGLSLEQVEAGLASCRAVPGRLQEIFNDQGIKVLVDYAHSDDALHNVLGALRPLTRGALITVFGCGGERDKGKRPLMGAAASLYSELSVVTSDNPRREDPDAIIQDILPGMQGEALAGNGLEAGSRRWVVEPDRRAAIRLAIALARPGDTVLIAGKGHEDYQIVGESRLHFDDREEAARALQEVRA